MFMRKKKSGDRVYLQVVENRWEDGKVKQRVIATLGRLDELQQSGQLDSLVRSSAKLSETLMVLDARARGEAPEVACARVGPSLIFERLWRETGCQEVVRSLGNQRNFSFAMDRAIFLTVLHRLFDPGSDRAGDKWRRDYRVAGAESLGLHHLYRAMAWLGEELPVAQQSGRTFSPRCTKDRIEEELFFRRQDLFSSLALVLIDTTSIFFYGQGGETLGKRGYSRDHRPELKQMVVAVVLDQDGRPICCEVWPGNTADVTALVPIVERLQVRFGLREVCLVADRGMISADVLAHCDQRGWSYILGARMRKQKEVTGEVLSRAGRYRVVHPVGKSDLAPLKLKEVSVGEHRYIVCLNEDRRKKDQADREAIVASLREKLKQGDKALVGNSGYRRYLLRTGEKFTIDEAALEREARFDGKWVLRTNTDRDAAEIALRYKQLWMVEDLFRSLKSILETRPIYHRRDETIRGHVFCSFLALVLRKELQDRLLRAGHQLEWNDIVRDLDTLVETDLEHEGKCFRLRSEAQGTCGAVFQAVGVALPPTLRRMNMVPRGDHATKNSHG
jgi:hypothetical protein